MSLKGTDGPWGSSQGFPSTNYLLEVQSLGQLWKTQVTEKPVYFLLAGSTFSVLLSTPGQLSKCSVMIRGISGKLMTKFFSQPLGCIWGILIFSRSLLRMPESLTPLLQRNIITKLETMVPLTPGQINNYVSF